MRGIWPFTHGKIWVDPVQRIPSNTVDINRARSTVCADIDSHGFDWQILLVCASGFLTDSYALFASNVVLLDLAYLYWPEQTDGRPELIINCLTLTGCMVGQILFGFLADLYGRRRLYGLELVIVIFSTLGMAQASTGYNNSMNIRGWIYFWRFFIGLGIGAEYPLTAIITAEFADVNRRAQMLAAVFSMQPIGQLLATGIGWGVLVNLNGKRSGSPDDINLTLDQTWRCLIGVGAAPAMLAILFRITIPESPRYTIDVIEDGKRAVTDIRRYHGEDYSHTSVMQDIGLQTGATPDATMDGGFEAAEEIVVTGSTATGPAPQVNGNGAIGAATGGNERTGAADVMLGREMPNYFTRKALKQYFYDDGNWRYLLATSMCWLLLDFAFYGLGINNPRQLAAIWASDGGRNITLGYDWANPYDQGEGIYDELINNARDYIITISIGSLAGSILLIWLINEINRKTWLTLSFCILALLFAIIAATLGSVEFKSSHVATIVFYSICQFFFNFGPNSLTFIIPAEIFPTKYRCTCHGFSAAMGKLGSIAVLTLFSRSQFTLDPTHSMSIALGVFSIVMALGAVLSWAWLPDVQKKAEGPARAYHWPVLPSKDLETLAKGMAYAVATEGQTIGLRKKIVGLFRRHPRIVRDQEFDLPSRTTGDDNYVPLE